MSSNSYRCVLQIAVFCGIALVILIAIQPVTQTIASRVEFGGIMGLEPWPFYAPWNQACKRVVLILRANIRLDFFKGYASMRLRSKPPCNCFQTSFQFVCTSPQESTKAGRKYNQKKRAATGMIVVTVAIVVTVSNYYDSDC